MDWPITFLSIASSSVRYSLMETGSLWLFSLRKKSISMSAIFSERRLAGAGLLRRLHGPLLDDQHAVVEVQGVGAARERINGEALALHGVPGVQAVDQALAGFQEGALAPVAAAKLLMVGGMHVVAQVD